MSKIESQTIKITTAGGDGAAVGSGSTLPIQGFLLDAYIDYAGTAPATTDVSIVDPVFGNLVVKSNNSTDCWLAPRKQSCDPAAADTGMFELIPLCSALTISVAQCNAITDAVSVTLRWLTP